MLTLWWNSLVLAGLAAVLGTGLGAVAALGDLLLERPWRRVLRLLAVVGLALPAFLVTGVWIWMLGEAGWLRAWVPLSIYGAWGTVWVLALIFWPVAFFLLTGAMRTLDRDLLEAEPGLSGIPFVRWLLWPGVRGASGAALLILFVLAFNQFSVPALLQARVFPAEIWVQFNTHFDHLEAFRLSLPLVILTCLGAMWLRRLNWRWPAAAVEIPAHVYRRCLGRNLARFALGLTGVLVGLGVLLPAGTILLDWRTWSELGSTFRASRWAMMWSVVFAAVPASMVLVVSWVGARRGSGELLWVPFVLPGVMLGVAILYLFNRPGWSGLLDGPWVVLLAFGLRYIALGWAAVRWGRGGIDRDLADAARLAGVTGWARFRQVEWPVMGGACAGAWYLVYLWCLWDVETLVLIVPPGAETLALRVFNLLHYGHNVQVNALCLMLLAAAAAPLVLRAVWETVVGASGRRATRSGWGRIAAVAVLAGAGVSCGPRAPEGSVEGGGILFGSVQVVGGRGNGLGQFHKPRSVTLDTRENLYAVDLTGRVQKFSADGVYLTSWQMPETTLGKPKGMGCDALGRILVIEPHYSRMNHFSEDGRLLHRWGVHGTDPGRMAFPRAVAVATNGDLWVSEYGAVERIQRFAADGSRVLTTIEGAGDGPGQLNRAEGLATDTRDRLYVADSCNHRVQVFGGDGRWIRSLGRAGQAPLEFSYPYDVRVDGEGRLYVCEFGNSRIQVLDAEGRFVEFIGGPGSGPGKLNNPWSIALSGRGDMYVADSMNHRVLKFVRRAGDRVSGGGRRLVAAGRAEEGEGSR